MIKSRSIFLLDAAALACCLLATLLFRFGPEGAYLFFKGQYRALAACILIHFLVAYLVGLYDPRILAHTARLYRRGTVWLGGTILIISFIFMLRLKIEVGRGVLFGFVPPAVLLSVVVRHGFWRAQKPRVFVAGGPGIEKEVLQVLECSRRSPYIYQGRLSIDESGGFHTMNDVDCSESHEIGALDLIVADKEFFIAGSPWLRSDRLGQVYSLVIDLVAFSEITAQRVPIEHVDNAWLMRIVGPRTTASVLAQNTKRLIDVSAALTGLVLGAPILAAFYVLTRLETSGPGFYSQVRLGYLGRQFRIFKLRSMKIDAETSGPRWSDAEDPRITKIGKIARKYRIDEIPQLVNVLRGEMSLVGPRPERPEIATKLEESLPLFPERLLMRPGITGWAQVNLGYVDTQDGSALKLSYDLYYIKNFAIALDVRIILYTIRTILYGVKFQERHTHVQDQSRIDSA